MPPAQLLSTPSQTSVAVGLIAALLSLQSALLVTEPATGAHAFTAVAVLDPKPSPSASV